MNMDMDKYSCSSCDNKEVTHGLVNLKNLKVLKVLKTKEKNEKKYTIWLMDIKDYFFVQNAQK